MTLDNSDLKVYEKLFENDPDFAYDWHLDKKNCRKLAEKPDWGQILTAIIINKDQNMSMDQKFTNDYSGVDIIHPMIESNWMSWDYVIEYIKTPFVLIGRDLRSISESTKLERSIRLLQDPKIGVVSGATRNITGHWKTNCLQSHIVNYNLYMKPGYEHSSCDCMECAVSDTSPFVTKIQVLEKIPLNTSLEEDSMFVDWFLRLQGASLKTLLCPDIMYHTYHSDSMIERMFEEDWQKLAGLHHFLGVVLDHSPKVAFSFNCDQAGLECKAVNQQDQALLLPWCCLNNFKHIFNEFEALSQEFDFHYEVYEGTVLG